MQGGAGGAYSTLIRLHNRQNLSDRAMASANREISSTCERLRVTDAVRNSALEVYKDVSGRLAQCCRHVRAVSCLVPGRERQHGAVHSDAKLNALLLLLP